MKNCFNKFLTFLNKNLHVILPMITLFCLAGFIGSLIFPNEVLDTNRVNTEESEEDFYISFLQGAEPVEIAYEMTTEARPLKGVQVGIHKNGSTLAGANLIYRVYVKQGNEETSYNLVSENVYDLGSQTYDFQYVYLPFSSSDLCQGDVRITFCYESGSGEETAPALRVNSTQLENTETSYRAAEEETIVEGGLLISYIYSHDTYPFLYDFRILTFVFLAASMTLSYKKPERKKGWHKKGGDSDEK